MNNSTKPCRVNLTRISFKIDSVPQFVVEVKAPTAIKAITEETPKEVTEEDKAKENLQCKVVLKKLTKSNKYYRRYLRRIRKSKSKPKNELAGSNHSIFTKFTFSKSRFSQNSNFLFSQNSLFQSLIFHKIHIF